MEEHNRLNLPELLNCLLSSVEDEVELLGENDLSSLPVVDIFCRVFICLRGFY